MKNVQSYSHAKEFLAYNLAFLMEAEAINNLIISLCMRMAEAPVNEGARFYSLSLKNGKIGGCAVQTSPERNMILWAEEAHYDIFSSEMNKFFHEHEIDFPGVLGPKKLAKQFAQTYAESRKLISRMHLDQGVYELQKLTPPAYASGFLRLAEEKDIPILVLWMPAFAQEALGDNMDEDTALAQAKSYIERKVLYIWEDGKAVSTCATSRATPNGISVNYVFTPKEYRGRGYASAGVAKLSEKQLEKYDFCTLFTDLSNPTSNSIYRKMGYKQIANFATYMMEKG